MPICLSLVVASSSGSVYGLEHGFCGFGGVLLCLKGVRLVCAGEAFVQALIQVLKAVLDLKLCQAQVVGIFCSSLLS